ncbi:MAG: nuclear transport factor 2 family protein [Acetobacteraceae bacterium]|nr:nuclear transport factor 2 family protein [Acetobacteraceae bacterium]
MDHGRQAARPTPGALFALLYRPGPRWVPGEPAKRQPLAGHLAYMEELSRAGRLALAGPFADEPPSGLAVLRAADAEEAAAVLAGDPGVRDGVLDGEARRWLPFFGDAAAAPRTAANVETVRRVFAAVEKRGDDAAGRDARRAAYRDAYAPGATIHEAPGLPYGGDYSGPDAVERHARGYDAAWSGSQGAAERELDPAFLAGGDRVAVVWRQRARDAATGERFDMPAVSVFELRGGRIVDARMFHFDPGAAAAFLHRAKPAAAR